MTDYEPGYLALYQNGELQKRAERLTARLAACDICPRECGDNRLKGKHGSCHTGARAIVATACAHHGEEPVISGSRGSGTIFFGNCNLKCQYCQNYQISQEPKLQRNQVTARHLAELMLDLQEEAKCHNVNLVTPNHVVPQIVAALVEAVPMGFRLPLVYNTSSYDSLKTLKELDGVIDIYLADLRYSDNDIARKYSRVRNYVDHARSAIKEMQQQVGDLVVDDEGIARRGLIVRHLIFPNNLAGSEESLLWLTGEVSPVVAVSVMSQYYPAHKAKRYPELNRGITFEEHDAVAELVERFGIINGWMQDMEATETYRPDFAQEKPFTE